MNELEINHLLWNFWNMALNPAEAHDGDESWNRQVQAIFLHGKGLEESLKYLFMERPDYQAFRLWLGENSEATVIDVPREPTLSPDDLAFFDEHGYVVVRNILTEDECAHARQAICAHLGIVETDPSTWYQLSGSGGLMVQFYHHPAINLLRQSGKLKKAYIQLYDSEDITGLIDKVSFNPPITPYYSFRGSPLHWDTSLELPIPFNLQGLLYLNDVDENDGAFQCVPGFHHQIENWLNSLPKNTDPRTEALNSLKPRLITGKAGDFIIWHKALPHSASPNLGQRPRFVQYHTYERRNLTEQKTWK